MSNRQPLLVTKSFLPPREEFQSYLDTIFASRSLTNQGELVRELERQLVGFLGTPHVLSCANGTLGLMMALRLAGVAGKKVVTTPFTYVATLSAIMWEGGVPVFADIDPETLCMSPASLRECLEKHPDIAAVVPVHVFGNACDVHTIEAICAEHGLICLYDACHAFGSSYAERSLLDYGDYAVCSFHATKLFHTVEGGCLVVHDEQDRHQATLLRAFGHMGDAHYSLGFNAKLSEPHAAMGLAVLPHVRGIISARRNACETYEGCLPKGYFNRPTLARGLEYNYAYFPIILDSEETLLALLEALSRQEIYPRRYFYPSLTTLPYLPEPARATPCPITDAIAPRILCLPLSAEITEAEINRVCTTIKNFFVGR